MSCADVYPCFPDEQYGVVTLVYSVVALLLVCLTYGMETGFFRFANHERWKDSLQVYTTALTALGCSSILFAAITLIFSDFFAGLIDCAGHPSYVWMMGIAVSIDAFYLIAICLPAIQASSNEVCHIKTCWHRYQHRA